MKGHRCKSSELCHSSCPIKPQAPDFALRLSKPALQNRREIYHSTAVLDKATLPINGCGRKLVAETALCVSPSPYIPFTHSSCGGRHDSSVRGVCVPEAATASRAKVHISFLHFQTTSFKNGTCPCATSSLPGRVQACIALLCA